MAQAKKKKKKKHSSSAETRSVFVHNCSEEAQQLPVFPFAKMSTGYLTCHVCVAFAFKECKRGKWPFVNHSSDCLSSAAAMSKYRCFTCQLGTFIGFDLWVRKT